MVSASQVTDIYGKIAQKVYQVYSHELGQLQKTKPLGAGYGVQRCVVSVV